MEFAAAKLAVGEDMPLMVIKSTVDMSQEGVQYCARCPNGSLVPLTSPVLMPSVAAFTR